MKKGNEMTSTIMEKSEYYDIFEKLGQINNLCSVIMHNLEEVFNDVDIIEVDKCFDYLIETSSNSHNEDNYHTDRNIDSELFINLKKVSNSINKIIDSFEKYNPNGYRNFLFLLFTTFNKPSNKLNSNNLLTSRIQTYYRKVIEKRYLALEKLSFDKINTFPNHNNSSKEDFHERDMPTEGTGSLILGEVFLPKIMTLITQVHGRLTTEVLEGMYKAYCNKGIHCIRILPECTHYESLCIIHSMIKTILGFDGGIMTDLPNPFPGEEICTLQIERDGATILIINVDHHDPESVDKQSTIGILSEILKELVKSLATKTSNSEVQNIIDIKKICNAAHHNHKIATTGNNPYLSFQKTVDMLIEPLHIIINFPDPDTLLPVAITSMVRNLFEAVLNYNGEISELKNFLLAEIRSWLKTHFHKELRDDYIFNPDKIIQILAESISDCFIGIDLTLNRLSILNHILDKLTIRLSKIFECVSEIDKAAGSVMASSFIHKIDYFNISKSSKIRFEKISCVRPENLTKEEYLALHAIPDDLSTEYQQQVKVRNIVPLAARYIGHLHELLRPVMRLYTSGDPKGTKLLMGYAWCVLANCFLMTELDGSIEFSDYDASCAALQQPRTKQINYIKEWSTFNVEECPIKACYYINSEVSQPEYIRTLIPLIETKQPDFVVVYMGQTKGMIGYSNFSVFGIGKNTQHVSKFTRFLSHISSVICGLNLESIKNFFGDGDVVRGSRNGGVPVPEKFVPEIIEWYIKINSNPNKYRYDYHEWLNDLQYRIVEFVSNQKLTFAEYQFQNYEKQKS